MHRTTWGIIYCLTGLGTLAAAMLLGRSVAVDSEPLALTGVSLAIASVAGARFAADLGWLKAARTANAAREAALTQAEIQIHTRSAILENHTQRALREMDEVDRERKAQNDADRLAMLAEIEAEREAMQDEFEKAKSDLRESAMRVGHMLGVRGLGMETVNNMAQVITLPVGNHRPTTMGEGLLQNR